jgi:phosphatidylserine/phosphatidylglycerophosphate/cardiolipin synthase-like enzyme
LRLLGVVLVAALLAGCAGSTGRDLRPREAEALLPITSRGPAQPDARFALPDPRVGRVQIRIQPDWYGPRQVRLRCDGRALLWTADRPVPLPPGTTRGALLSGGEGAVLHWTPDSGDCTLRWGRDEVLTLTPETTMTPALATLALRDDVCPASAIRAGNPLADAFLADTGMMTTCPFSVTGSSRFLVDGVEALNARMAALLGRPLSRAELLSGDPNLPLDFSQAPDLELIMVSSLNFRADFQAALLARALAYHANRGTPVRIMMSATLVHGRDQDFLTDLAARHPSIQLQFYTWQQDAPGRNIDRLQRSQHTKIFLTLSADPDATRVIVGGRNLHDGYFFDRPFDLTEWPALRDHVEERLWARGYFSIFEDLDVELRDTAFVRAIAAQALAYWHRDTRSVTPLGPAQLAPPRSDNGQGPLMRHAISLPWSDDRGLQRWVVEMIDAARSDIVIVSEFFFPPDAILEALLRAEARGVRVRVLLQLGSPEPTDVVIRPLNIMSAARWGDRFSFFAYRGPAQLLHVKMLVIDRELSLVGSANFNRRSYVHDSENVLAILDRETAEHLLRAAERLIAASAPIPHGQPVPALGPLIESWPWLHDLL